MPPANPRRLYHLLLFLATVAGHLCSSPPLHRRRLSLSIGRSPHRCHVATASSVSRRALLPTLAPAPDVETVTTTLVVAPIATTWLLPLFPGGLSSPPWHLHPM
ncbi:hypothetical protein B296_00009897 [Ensete ventricosum]|uniref:Uncharacterized protein n=1 Tax=Ensete ventricosum TaxID=4639 RepID=A0A426YH68_ENSVE|nr:hypothetical protein B296_00009897 [Ensete ventricosum]